MKPTADLQIFVPHILILDEPENINKISHDDISYVMLNILENSSSAYGLLSADFPEVQYEDEDTTAMCWYSNLYNISSDLRSGKPKKGDLSRIESRISDHLIRVSLELSLDIDNPDKMSIFENGILDVKMGKGENKRLYRITYNFEDTNMEVAMEECQKEIQTLAVFEEDIPEKRTLH